MYSEQATQDLDALIEQYAPLVKKIAQHLIVRFPASVQLDDLIQAGIVGLIEAARKYNGSHGASFATYAGIRIRGAMIDDVRKGDWVPRSVHRNNRDIGEAFRRVESRVGREANDQEVADEMGISLDDYYQHLKDSSFSRLFSLDEMLEREESNDEPEGDEEETPSVAVLQGAMKQAVVEQIDALPERERLVLSLYYEEELNLKEIGEVIGVSESRVSQIHSQAMARLRSRLNDWTRKG
jgi:RNA polymerase sigma factor for flagellar operon FliA